MNSCLSSTRCAKCEQRSRSTELEHEHETITTALARLHKAIETGADGVDVAGLIEECAAYSAAHFAHEEEFLRQAGEPSLVFHSRAHRQLLEGFQLLALAAKTERVALALMDALDVLHAFEWHIAKWDGPAYERALGAAALSTTTRALRVKAATATAG